MSEKLQYKITDDLVQHALQVSQNIPGRPMIIVGGMAVQLYNSDLSLNRPTDDIDILPQQKLSTKEFREEVAPYFTQHADELGMAVDDIKGHRSYELAYSGEGERPFFVHLSYFSENYWKRHESWKQREIDNSSVRDFGDRGKAIVFRPEDILANKLRRLRNLYSKGHITGKNLDVFHALRHGDVEGLAAIDLESRLEDVQDRRWDIIQSLAGQKYADNEQVEPYKVLKDTYDIGLLGRCLVRGEYDFSPEYYGVATQNLRDIPE